MHRRSASVGGETSAVKRAQNAAARAAAARLARVLALSHGAGDDGEVSGGNLTARVETGYGTLPFPERRKAVESMLHQFMLHQLERPLISNGSTPMITPSITPWRAPSDLAVEPPISRHRVKRFSADLGHLNFREMGNHRGTSEIQDEIDMLQEENKNILEKLRLAEDRCEAAEARARELEKQGKKDLMCMPVIGRGGSEEVLSPRYWVLAVHHGDDNQKRQKNRLLNNFDVTGEGGIEDMLSVDKGKRELASLKVEDHVMSILLQHRQPNVFHQSTSEISQEESEDVLFKQAWLTYFWRRAKVHGVEEEVAAVLGPPQLPAVDFP